DLADHEVELLLPLVFKPALADRVQLREPGRIAGDIPADFDHLEPEPARLLDLIAKLHLRTAGEAELRERHGISGAKLVDREAAAGEQVHLGLAHLDRCHAVALARGELEEPVEQWPGVFRPGMDAAELPDVLPLCAVRNEPGDVFRNEHAVP